MSDDIAIKVQGLSKRYRIGQRERYKSARESLMRLFRRPERPESASTDQDFWALKDVNFEVKRGEVLGVIGRNGAGKSTLLKVLSRITEPTQGRIEINGRVGSLLEVGTGFHPELTGRENVFLNGAILGMREREIRAKFDEIVAFAEIEKFIDTPVKRYSSGMYTRLAFAVAAHLEPEILIVDEVLAVGDAAFQKKCMNKMGEVSSEGRTVLFVSHNISAIESLCHSGVFLANGCIRAVGPIQGVVDQYLESGMKSETSLSNRRDRQGSGRMQVDRFYVVDRNGNRQDALRSGEDYTFVMECLSNLSNGEVLTNVVASIAIADRAGVILLFRSNFTDQNLQLSAQQTRVECAVSDLNLAPGHYSTVLFLSHGEAEVLDLVQHATELAVEGGDFFGTGSQGIPSICHVLSRATWSAK